MSMTATQGKIKTQNRIPCHKCNATMQIQSITDRRALGGVYHQATCPKCGYTDSLWNARNKAEVVVCQKTEAYNIEAVPGKPGHLRIWKNGPDGRHGYPLFIDSKRIVQRCGCKGHAEGDYCRHTDRAFFKTPYLWDSWNATWNQAVSA